MGKVSTSNPVVGIGALILLCMAGGASAQYTAPDPGTQNLQGLSARAESGALRCPDGSTRPFSGENPSDLIVSMACSEPADVAAARRAQAQAAVEAKNTRAEQDAALAGQSGVVAGLEATVETGRPDFFLRQTWVWIVGILLALIGVGAVIGRSRK